MALNETKVT